MRILLTVLLFFIGATASAQVLVPFGGTRPQDTAYADRSLRVNGILRFPFYATTDTNLVFGIDAAGKIVLRQKGSGGSAIDTTSLSNRINQRVKYTDTAAMMAPYATKVNLKDTAILLRGLIAASTVDTTSLSNRINQRVKYTDTALILSPYATKVKVSADSQVLAMAINQRVKYTDTAAMLAPYATKANLKDTATVLRGLIVSSVVDTTSLSTRINQRVRYMDTAAMLAPYATKANLKDTATVLRGLISASTVDTTSLSNRINQRVKYTDTAAMLAPYATKAKVLVDSIALAAAINARVKYTDTAGMLGGYINSAINGLTKTSKNVSLGGSLTGATTITTTNTNTLAVAGLQSGTISDSIVVVNASTGVMRRISSARISSGGSSLTGYTDGSSTGNTALGVDAAPGPLSDFNNTNIGYRAGYLLSSGGDQVAVGSQALTSNTTGLGNTAVGAASLRLTTANYNTGVGWRTMYMNTTGTNNGAFGYQALYSNTSGQYCYAFGSLALYSNTTARYNVGVGDQTLFANSTGWYNTAIGSQAGSGITSGQYNTAIGNLACNNITSGSQNFAIGYNTALPSATADGQMNINNIISGSGVIGGWAGNVGVGLASPSYKLDVAGVTRVASIITNSGTPSVSYGTGIGASATPTAWAISGDNSAGLITFTPSASPAGGQVIFTLTLANSLACPNRAYLQLYPENDNAAGVNGGTTTSIKTTGTATTISAVSGTLGLSSGSSYIFNYSIKCR